MSNAVMSLSKVLMLSDNTTLGTQAVSAKTLYHELTNGDIKNYSRWVKKNILENDFATEKEDFISLHCEDYTGRGQTSTDYALTIDFAKELCMMSKCQKGKEIRKYFIECERKLKAGNTPSYQISNPIERAKRWIEEEEKRQQLQQENEVMKPKALFADAVSASKTSILIGDLAKLLNQNGIDIGQKRLFAWLRDNGYLMKTGSSKNMPTQRAMEQKLFEIKEGSYINSDGVNITTRTTKVTGKGQIYFVNTFLADKI